MHLFIRLIVPVLNSELLSTQLTYTFLILNFAQFRYNWNNKRFQLIELTYASMFYSVGWVFFFRIITFWYSALPLLRRTSWDPNIYTVIWFVNDNFNNKIRGLTDSRKIVSLQIRQSDVYNEIKTNIGYIK